MPRTVAVTGATGLIGSKVTAALLDRGDAVVALVRGPPRPDLPGAVEQRAWSASDPAADLADVDAVVHLAGEPIAAGRWTAARKRAIADSRIHGTRSIVEGIRAAGGRVRVLVSASGIDIHPDPGDAPVDERSPTGGGFLGELGERWEAEAARARESGARVVALRTGLVLAREGGALPMMLTPFRLGLGGPMGSGRQYWPWIHLADEVGLVLHALDAASLDGPMICAAPHPVRQRDFARALGRTLGRPAVLPAPAFALRLALGEMAGTVLASHRAVPRVALESGYTFRFPTLDAALADLISAR